MHSTNQEQVQTIQAHNIKLRVKTAALEDRWARQPHGASHTSTWFTYSQRSEKCELGGCWLSLCAKCLQILQHNIDNLFTLYVYRDVIFMSIWDSYARYINYVQYTENSVLTCENYNAIVNTGMMLILYPRTQYDTWHLDYDESFTVLIPFLSVFVQPQCLRPTDSIGTPPRKQAFSWKMHGTDTAANLTMTEMREVQH